MKITYKAKFTTGTRTRTRTRTSHKEYISASAQAKLETKHFRLKLNQARRRPGYLVRITAEHIVAINDIIKQ